MIKLFHADRAVNDPSAGPAAGVPGSLRGRSATGTLILAGVPSSLNIADAAGNPISPVKEEFTPGAVHVHDLQATILHLLGIDHTRLTFRFQGRDYRLTDVHGHVVKDLLA